MRPPAVERDEPATPLSRRDALRLLAGLVPVAALAGCSTGGSLINEHARLATTGLFSRKSAGLTRDVVAQFPAASMGIKVGRKPEALILLSRVEDRDLVWRSGDNIVLVTRGGRLLKTAGLRSNLGGTHFITPDPVDGTLLSTVKTRMTRLIDLGPDYGTSLEARSTFTTQRSEKINILGAEIATVRVREKVRVPRLKWGHTNYYWADERTGFVWRSRQRFHINYPALTLTVLRPARLSSG